MTISIECVLESAVFFPGDTLFCRIHIHNKSLSPFIALGNNGSGSGSGNKINESISWITTQVYGNMIVEPKYFKMSTSSPKLAASSSSSSSSSMSKKQQLAQQQKKSSVGLFGGISTATSLPNITDTGENGRSIFASPTTILGSDINIPVGQTKSFIYFLTLPHSLPPSFKGTSLRYSYFLSIAAQLFTHPAQILTIPIRILTPASALRQLKFKLNITNHDFEEGSTETPQETNKNLETVSKWPISAYKKSQYFPVPYPQNLSQYDSNNTRKSVIDLLNKYSVPVSINISKGTEKLATFSILKTAFTLGDTVCGTFDFSIATIPCYKILVKLECEETVEQKYQQSSRSKSNRRLYGELHEYTTNVRQTHFMFHIPVEASQEFSTKHVSVKWILKFEFVTPVKNPYHLQQQQQQTQFHQQLQHHLNNNQTPTSMSRSNSIEMDNEHQQHHLHPPQNKSISKSSSYNEDLSRHQQQQLQHQQNYQLHGQLHNSSGSNSSGVTTGSQSTPSTPPQHHLSKSVSNRVISEVPSDSESNISSDSGAMVSEDVLHSSSSSIPGVRASTSNNTSVGGAVGLSRHKRYDNNPVVGVLINNDENNVNFVDTLHWSLPIRVFVCSPPHELLHTNKNELFL